ncbi:MAG: PAS domain S-box protein, partial [Comamonadaceae bacterium]
MQPPPFPQPPASVLLDALFATPACGHCLVDPDGLVVRVNAEWLRSTGFAEADVLGRDIVSLFPGSEDLSRALHELARAGRQVHVPKHAQLVGGHESWCDGWVAPVPWDGGGTGLLITARELRNDPGPAQGSAMAAVFDSIEDVIYAKDARGRMVYANPATLALVGKSMDEVLGRTDAEFLSDPQAAAAVMETDRRVMGGGQPVELAEHVPLPDGTERVWLSRKVPWRDARGEVIGLLGISRDITQREATGRELRRMRGLMESTLENFPTAIVFKDREGRFIEV